MTHDELKDAGLLIWWHMVKTEALNQPSQSHSMGFHDNTQARMHARTHTKQTNTRTEGTVRSLVCSPRF